MARILLAEDDNDMRMFLARALERAGHEVHSFGEGLSAFEELKLREVDLLDIAPLGLGFAPDGRLLVTDSAKDVVVELSP